ncbi:hypothetical protein [Humisphaera borealis]|uniref:CBM6 domain-containing protein n=1 Tax=Humisphaera borealis TaxID=2807512 RepID=A0A7M2X0I7_9BACT|nr:hypothetical protein [Humisphaera borealis]QOV91287.1 hypothetical protein IPV69_08000 [Humisphaera borealis]
MPVLFDTLESRQLFISVAPSSFEQYWIELVNRARANPALEATRLGIDLNEGLAANTISTAAKPPLALNGFITDASGPTPGNALVAPLQHAQWVRVNEQISLVGALGSLPIDRLIAAGYVFTGTAQGNAENVTALVNPTQPLDIAAVDTIHANLFIDSGILNRTDRVNLFSTSYREVGAGLDQGTWTPTGQPAQQAVAAVMDFALATNNSAGDVFLTGVAYNDNILADNFYTPNAGNGEGLNNVTVTARRLSDGATFTTATFPSGGYSLRLTPGTYEVTATGGGLGTGNAVIYPAVVVGGQNVKRDFTTQQIVTAPVNPGTVGPPTPNPVTLKGDIKGKVRIDRAGLRNKEDLRYTEAVIGAIVYVDLDNSGTRNSNEPFGKVLPNTNLVGNGIYNITGLNPGVYKLRVEAPSGYRVSIPRSTVQDVTIVSGKVAKPKVFALTEHTLVSGRVYKDANFNGNFESTFDKGLADWRVFIDLNNDSIWQRETEPAVKSESDGYYAFRDLLVGTYTIRVISKSNFIQTEPTNNGAYVVQLQGSALDVIDRDFGQRQVTQSPPPPPGGSTPTITDPGFESPSLPGTFQYNPPNPGWTFLVGGGISGNGSSFTASNPPAPEGTQVAFLQVANAVVSQSITGWSSGTYRVSFQAAARAGLGGTMDCQVLIDGQVVGTFTPSTTSYQAFTTSTFTVVAGSHTLQFKGINTPGGDQTVFLDSVSILLA